MKTSDAPPPSTARTPAPKDDAGRRGSPVEQALVNRFRAALDARGLGGESAERPERVDDDALAPVQERDARERELMSGAGTDTQADSRDSGQPGDLPTLGLSQTMAPGGVASALATAATVTPGYSAAVVAQLLEKHVKQLLVSDSTAVRSEQPSVMLNLTDAVLPGTQLTLTQTEQGWRLDSRSSSASSYRAVRDLAPQLQERFSERGLGELLLDVRLL
ncbi:MAG: hypothetical protein AB8G17_05625 [Gammaproteobacteria bacterium]